MIDIPFAVAGGIRTRDQAAACLEAGADKVSVNSPALERPRADRASSPMPLAASASCSESTACARRRLSGEAIYRRPTPCATPAGGRWTGRGEGGRSRRRRDRAQLHAAATASAHGYDIEHTRCGGRGGAGAGHRLGRRRRAGAFPRCLPMGGRERCAGGDHLPRPHHLHSRSEGVSRRDAGSKCAAERGRHCRVSPGRRWTGSSPPSSRTAERRRC